MKRPSLSWIPLLSLTLLLCCCATTQKQVDQKAPASESSQPEGKRKASVEELRRLYESSLSEYRRLALQAEREQLAICLRAIDDGVIRLGGPVSAVDEIYGTNFAERLPAAEDELEKTGVGFAPQFCPWPNRDGRITEAYDYTGWYLVIDYDKNGKIQDYYLSDVHKSPQRRIPEGKEQALAAELKQAYGAARTEDEKRAVCLRAVEEGLIQESRPVSTIDEIFGTHLASDLPTRTEWTRRATVECAPSAPDPANAQGGTKAGWFMSVAYTSEGTIENYRLTNLRK